MSSTPPQIPVPTGEIGTSGLRHYSGYMQEDFDPKLRGRRLMELFREMRDNTAILGSSFQAIELTIRRVEWCVEPASSSDEDKARAQFVAECIHDMSFSWVETVLEHLTAVQYGFATCELVYKRRQGYQESGAATSRYNDGRIGWSKVPLRGQETVTRWDLDQNGGIRGFWQSAPPDFRERYIPITKALLFRTSRERNNPEGRSPLRSAYWDYFAAKRLTESMLIGAERDLAGFPVVRVPATLMSSSASAEEKAVFEAYKTIARDTRRGDQEGLVLPSDRGEGGQAYHYDFQLLSSGGKREFNVAEMVRDRTRMMALVLLTDLLLMGHEKVGSYALAESKGGLFETSLDGYLQSVADPYNQHAIPRLLMLNGWPPAPAPILKHKPLTAENLAALADFLQKLVASKLLTPDAELEDDIRERANLTPRPAGVVPAAASQAPGQDPAGAPPAAAPPDQPDGEEGDEGDEDDAAPSGAPGGEAEDLAHRLADDRPPLRIGEVAGALGFSAGFVRKLISAGAVRAVVAPGTRERRIPAEELRRLLEEHRPVS